MAGQNQERSSNLRFSHSSFNLPGLSALADQCPHPNNSLVGLLTAAYSLAPIPSVDVPRGPLQPSQILAIVDDVLRELDGEMSDEDTEDAMVPLPANDAQ